MAERIQLAFGALAPRLCHQIWEQGRSAPRKSLQRWQAIGEAITMCYLHHVISETQAHRARQKLCNIIGKGLRPKRGSVGK